MKRSLYRRQFAGFLFAVTLGSALHFAYAALGRNPILAAVASVNESTWEHMKLLFFPSFLCAVVGYFIFGRRYADYWQAKLAGICLGLMLIPALYYTCVGVFGRSPDWFNIASFFVAAAAQFALETHILSHEPRKRKCDEQRLCLEKQPRAMWRVFTPRACFAALCVVALAFVLFTYFPPRLPLFRDPVTGRYGILN